MKNNVISLTGKSSIRERKRDEKPEHGSQADQSIDEVFADLGIKSFKSEYRRLSKMAGSDDFASSQAAYALLKAQFAMLINAMPLVEAAMYKYKSDRSAYAMVALSNHLREIAHDLRSFGDQSEMVERIRKDVIQLVLSSLASLIVAQVISTRRKLHSKLSPKSAELVNNELMKFQEGLSKAFSDAEVSAAERVSNVLRN